MIRITTLCKFILSFGCIWLNDGLEQRLPLGWQEPLSTCPGWHESTPYELLYELPTTPTLASSMLLDEQFHLKFSQTAEIVMFAEDHTNPRMINIIKHNLPILFAKGYKVFADELPPHSQLSDLIGQTKQHRINFYKALQQYNISSYRVDDSYHHELALKAYFNNYMFAHALQNTFEQRDQVMALRDLYLLLLGNGKLFTLNGYLHLGIARHLLAYGCKVMFISEHIQTHTIRNYDNYILTDRQRLLEKLLKHYPNFIYVELPVETLISEQEKKIINQVSSLITISSSLFSRTISKIGLFSSIATDLVNMDMTARNVMDV